MNGIERIIRHIDQRLESYPPPTKRTCEVLEGIKCYAAMVQAEESKLIEELKDYQWQGGPLTIREESPKRVTMEFSDAGLEQLRGLVVELTSPVKLDADEDEPIVAKSSHPIMIEAQAMADHLIDMLGRVADTVVSNRITTQNISFNRGLIEQFKDMYSMGYQAGCQETLLDITKFLQKLEKEMKEAQE